MSRPSRRPDTKTLARAGVLSALIVVMTIVPYTGYITYGPIEITTLHIVVAVGAAMLGWKYGAFLGLVWGVTCVLRALTNPLWAPFVNPLVSVVPRVCVGTVAGLIAGGLKKCNCRGFVSAAAAAAGATVTNTVLVLTALRLFSNILTGDLARTIYMTLVSINGVVELIASIVIVPSVLAALQPRMLVLGVDMGASTTKFALVRRGRCVRAMRKPDDKPLEEALAEFGLAGVSHVMLTGVGASFVKGDVAGIPTTRADEFVALSRGASHCAKNHNCLIVSIGTGTSFTRSTLLRSWHVGGTGMGGGMLRGLSVGLLGISDMDALQQLAEKGDLRAVDLQLADVCAGSIGNMGPDTTVANLSKAGANSRKEDLAAGLCNLIFQSIGIMAAFAVKKHLTRTVVLVGTITDWPIARGSLDAVAALHKVKFIVPEYAPFATAIGAAMEYRG